MTLDALQLAILELERMEALLDFTGATEDQKGRLTCALQHVQEAHVELVQLRRDRIDEATTIGDAIDIAAATAALERAGGGRTVGL